MCDTSFNVPENGLHLLCRICLEGKGVRKMSYEEMNWYQNVSNASSPPSPSELRVCWVCGHLLRKYMRFLHQCQKAHYLFTQLAQDPKTYISITDKAHTFIHTKLTINSIPPTVIDSYNTCTVDVKLENCDAKLDNNNCNNVDDERAVSDDGGGLPLNIIKDEVDIEEIDISTVTVSQTGGQTDKPQSAPREGFSSPMKQEIEECRSLTYISKESEVEKESVDETMVPPPPKPSANNNDENMLNSLECSNAMLEVKMEPEDETVIAPPPKSSTNNNVENMLNSLECSEAMLEVKMELEDETVVAPPPKFSANNNDESMLNSLECSDAMLEVKMEPEDETVVAPPPKSSANNNDESMLNSLECSDAMLEVKMEPEDETVVAPPPKSSANNNDESMLNSLECSDAMLEVKMEPEDETVVAPPPKSSANNNDENMLNSLECSDAILEVKMEPDDETVVAPPPKSSANNNNDENMLKSLECSKALLEVKMEPDDETVVAPPLKSFANNNDENMLKKLECSEAMLEKVKEEYRCYTCNQGFPDRQELEQHITRHVSLPSIVIPKLPLPPSGDDRSDKPSTTPDKTPQKIHISQRNPTIKTQGRCSLCAVCNDVFPNIFDVEKHVKEKHAPPIQCTECSAYYPDYFQFKKHVRDGCRRRFKCKFCDKTYGSFSNVKNHENSVHSEKYVSQRDMCQNQFASKNVPRSHILSQPSIKTQVGPGSEIKRTLESMSAKMVIFLPNGEQRLITFALPKESCTLQEVLEQVNVPFTEETHIQCMQCESSDIDYFVSVGCRIEDMLQNHPIFGDTSSKRARSMLSQPRSSETSTTKKSQSSNADYNKVVPKSRVEQTPDPQSAKMLIFLQNGEQILERLITFTLPKEDCTLQDILTEVNVPFTEETHIQCMQCESSDIDYFVSVGCTTRIEEMLQNHPMITGDTSSETSTTKKSQSSNANRRRRSFCPVCNTVFPGVYQARKHVKEHHKPPIQCTICYTYHPDYAQFKQHVKDGCRRRYKCKLCDKTYGTFLSVEVHENRVHPKKKAYHCNVCQKQFYLQKWLRKHMLSHLRHFSIKKTL